jgi:RNA polymerase sigma-70 factor, ECF subfamily
MRGGPEVQEPDPTTLRAAARGDHAAFASLVRLYQPHIWRFLRNMLRDDALAEDVAQETFLRVYRNLAGFRFRSKFSTWLFQIARNAAIDAIRKRDRQLRIASRFEREAMTATVEHPEAGPMLDAMLSSLSDEHREAFVAVEVLGFTYVDAAATLGIPEGTVKSRVFHARRNLAAWVGATGEGGAAHDA